MSESIDNEFKKAGKISIKPYVNPKEKDTMGLTENNYVVFPGTSQLDTIAAIEKSGKVRYITGLNEFDPNLNKLPDADKKAKIKQIRAIVAKLEHERSFKDIDPEDANFWSKVETFAPENHETWRSYGITLNNNEIVLDPLKNLDDLVKICAIEANGYSLIAKNYEEAVKSHGTKKWYLEKQIQKVNKEVSITKLKNKALAKLQEVYEGDSTRLMYIAKNIAVSGSPLYTTKTPPDLFYEDLDKYINGKAYDIEIRRCSNNFLEVAELEMEDLKLRAITKDAIFHKMIVTRPDGYMYETSTSTALGRSVVDIVEYFKNPLNEEILTILMEKVEALW